MPTIMKGWFFSLFKKQWNIMNKSNKKAKRASFLDAEKKTNEDFENNFYPLFDKYLPAEGEGNTMASQIITAFNKLAVGWYEQGNTYDYSATNDAAQKENILELSTFANWLYEHVSNTRDVLEQVMFCKNGYDYENLIFELGKRIQFNIDEYEKLPRRNLSIYDMEDIYFSMEVERDPLAKKHTNSQKY